MKVEITEEELLAIDVMCDYAHDFKIEPMMEGEDVEEGQIRYAELEVARNFITRCNMVRTMEVTKERESLELALFDLITTVMSENDMDMAVDANQENDIIRNLLATYRVLKKIESDEVALKITASYFNHCDPCTIANVMIYAKCDVDEYTDEDLVDFMKIVKTIERL